MKWVKLSKFNMLFGLLILILANGLVFTGCQNKIQKSILVIALDDFTANNLNCMEHNSDSPSGIVTLCNESVRFTHAYTPSVLSNPALASLLTGLYPYEHKVRNNSYPQLTPEFETTAEVALKNGYRTSFFSGGAPALSRSGLHQGFEDFRDNIQFNSNLIYKPISESVLKFQDWVESDINKSFFSVIYAPDLSYINAQTFTKSGEARTKGYDSQLSEVDNNLDQLFTFLKKKNLWNNTLIVLVGLNGQTDITRLEVVQPLNLHSENTQIALLIKPWQKTRDEQLNWSIDRNVSLVDLGITLKEFVNANSLSNKIENSEEFFQKLNLKKFLFKTETQEDESKPILIESGWSEWHNFAPIKYGLVWNNYLFLQEENELVFNTFTDKSELAPIDSNDIQPEFKNYIKETKKLLNIKSWKLKNKNNIRLHQIPYTLWTNIDNTSDLFNELKRSNFDKTDSLYQAVIDKLNPKLTSQTSPKINACLNLLKLEPSQLGFHQKKCNDPLFIKFLNIAKQKNIDELEWHNFIKSYSNYLFDQQIIITNLAMHSLLDIDGIESHLYSSIDIALNLPQYRIINEKIKSSLIRIIADDWY